MKVQLEWVGFGTERWKQLVELRREVLRKPLGLEYTPAQLAEEEGQLHLGAWDKIQPMGCLILKPAEGKTIVMRQVAVAVEAQGKGVGRSLVLEAEQEARRLGKTRITLHARENARRFYERLGYHVEGTEFIEVGLPHRSMAKDL